MASREFNIKFISIPETTEESYTKLFVGYDKGLMCSVPGGFVLPPHYANSIEKMFQIQPRKDDVWITSFPNAGITLMLKKMAVNKIFNSFFSPLRFDFDFGNCLASGSRIRL